MADRASAIEQGSKPWPAVSLAEAQALLCAPGARFEMETVVIRGVPTRVWTNAPPTLGHLLAHSRSHGDATFVVYEDERVSYGGFVRATATLAAHFARHGVVKGDRVALAMRNLPEWPVAFFAAVSLGAIVVPLNAWWTGDELEYALGDSGAKLLVCDAERLARIAPATDRLTALTDVIVSRAGDGEIAGIGANVVRLEEVIGAASGWSALADVPLPPLTLAPDDEATIFYTSGTTGHPKGALGTHRNITSNIMASGYAAARSVLRRGDPLPDPQPRNVLLVIPLFHVTACSAGLMGFLASGSTMVLMHKWETVRAMELIERERIHQTGGVPTIAWQLLEHPERHRFDLSSLDTISYGGAPSAPELVRKIASDLKSAPGNGWGMTETMATVTSHSGEDYLHRPDSCGPPVPVSDVRIMAEDGATELGVGEVGELWARGPQIVVGYWNKPEATAETFREGWVRTGDLGYIDEEGFCYICDRAKDMIIRGGENIYSSEVENVLYDHPAVTDAAIIGLPHRTLGEEPAAVVHLAPGSMASEAELQAWVRGRLAAFKVPVRIVFCKETLPRNANGKILKKDLKALFD